MISAGFFQVYAQLGPQFEKATGHHLITTRGPSLGDSPEAIPTRLARGEEADVVIMDGHGADMLDQRKLSKADSRIKLADSFIGMVVKSGQPKPDISRESKEDAARGEVRGLLGLEQRHVSVDCRLQEARRRRPSDGQVAQGARAANGRAGRRRGRARRSGGRLPAAGRAHPRARRRFRRHRPGIQPSTYFVGELTANTKQPEAGIELLRFLSSTDAALVISKAGLKPLAK
jgi:molybdate transport system substrate-binding protein